MTNVSKKYSCASCIRQYSSKSQVPTGGSTLYILARHSSNKASTTSSHEGKALRVEQDVPVYIIGRKIFTMLLNQRHYVLLSDKELCAFGVIATVQPRLRLPVPSV
jgi:hypothetical protein